MENEKVLRTVPGQIGDLASGLAKIISQMDEKKRVLQEKKENEAINAIKPIKNIKK